MTTAVKTEKTLKDLLLLLSNFKGAEFYFYCDENEKRKAYLEYDGLRYYEGNSGEFIAKYNTIDGIKEVVIDDWNELIHFVAEQ